MLSSSGVLVSGRYGHGKPRKPVNPPLLALHRFQSYIILNFPCFSHSILKMLINTGFIGILSQII